MKNLKNQRHGINQIHGFGIFTHEQL